MKPRPALPFVGPNLNELDKVALKDARHPPTSFIVKDDDVALGIEVERSKIGVR